MNETNKKQMKLNFSNFSEICRYRIDTDYYKKNNKNWEPVKMCTLNRSIYTECNCDICTLVRWNDLAMGNDKG